MSFTKDLEQRLRASYPCLYIVAREDWRCNKEVQKVAEGMGLEYHTWSITSGWDGKKQATDPLEALQLTIGKSGVWCLTNFHLFLQDQPEMIQTVKDTVQVGKSIGGTLVFICNVYKLPDELQDDVSRMEFGLPDRQLLSERIDYLLESTDGAIPTPSDSERESIVEAALGMTTWEAENALTLSAIEEGKIDPKLVAREKARAVAKSGILEFYDPQVGMADVGGLDNLKAWLVERRSAFTKEAKEFGLPDLKGILLCGVPGCGKSLTAKAVSSDWGLPLIRFDLGRLFQGLVGASEENTRRALAVAEAVAPVVLWIDEIEKGMSGLGGSGVTDSGVTARVFGTIISWMQERSRPVFLVATANQVWNLPPELLRAGRWDEVFAVDLPSQQERIDILAIHVRKRGRDPENFRLEYVARESPQFSGAELESVVVKGLFRAFSEGREIETDDLIYGVHSTVPLAVTRKEDIEVLRKWASTRAIPASSAEPPKVADESMYTERRRMLRLTTYVEDMGEQETPGES